MDRRASSGFSLVELLVALVFTMVLMAGMSAVFRASITNFYTSGEKLSSMRRNRSSLDLLYDDLNNAGMALADITTALTSSDTNPAFYVIPNATVASAGAADPQTTDELYISFDQPLPFDGTLKSGGGSGTSAVGETAVSKVLKGAALTAGTDDTYEVECLDKAYADSVVSAFASVGAGGMCFHIKDNLSHAALKIDSVTASGSLVTVKTVTTVSLATQVTGRGDSGVLRPNQRVTGSGVVFILPAQMVRYRIRMMPLDPANANGTPCLVREQKVYDPSVAFDDTNLATQIISENVAGFKVFLSADSGATWAGQAVTATGLANGWVSGIKAALNTQLATLARADYTTTAGNQSWYRDIPVLVRLDVTTRTATQRTEYDATNTVAAFKNFTQSLVLLPRHFGLTLK